MELDAKFEDRIMALIIESVPGKFRKNRIVRQTHLQKELGMDSICLLSLLFRFEESFGIDITQLGIDINIARLKTVDDVLAAARDIMSKVQAVS